MLSPSSSSPLPPGVPLLPLSPQSSSPCETVSETSSGEFSNLHLSGSTNKALEVACNYKSKLNNLIQSRYRGGITPNFKEIQSEEGSIGLFRFEVIIGPTQDQGRGIEGGGGAAAGGGSVEVRRYTGAACSSKKEAQQSAARLALEAEDMLYIGKQQLTIIKSLPRINA